ncbi:hypothetical protein Droror1_Dr00017681 [Drosera rotundifolia]
MISLQTTVSKSWRLLQQDLKGMAGSYQDCGDFQNTTRNLRKSDPKFIVDFNLSRNAQNLSMTTPIKDCGAFHYHVNGSGNMIKVEGSKETSSQFKRRRMLQFSDEVLEPSFQSEDVCCLLS